MTSVGAVAPLELQTPANATTTPVVQFVPGSVANDGYVFALSNGNQPAFVNPSTNFVLKGGQAGAFSLGSTDSNTVSILTNNTARVVVDATGSTGFGVGTPTASVHVKAGTAAAGTAPLKFTSGTNLTTAETGAMEYDGTNLYFTPTGTTRRTFAYVDQLGTATTVGAGAGTAAAPSLGFSGDTDTGLFSSAADTLGFATGGTNRFNLSSAGLVSITTGGGLVTSSAGTASAPTFSFAGDSDTGWFSPAANTLAASTGGSERVRIDSSGNIGIGTTNPSSRFEVIEGGIANGSLAFSFVDNEAPGTLTTLPELFGGSITNNFQIGMRDFALINRNFTSQAGTQGFSFAQQTGVGTFSTLMYINGDNGNVGIGTTAPTNVLSFSGSGARTVWMERHSTANTAGNNLTLQAGGATSAATDRGGGSLILASGIATGTGSSQIQFQTASAGTTGTADSLPTTKMTILGNGNVGIGTTSPGMGLDVQADNGSARIAGTSAGLTLNRAASSSIAPDIYFQKSRGTNAAPTGVQNGDLLGNLSFGGYDGTNFVTRPAGIFAVVNGTVVAGSIPSDLAFTAGSSGTHLSNERMRITSSGNVGIGTTSPTAALHLRAGTATANTAPLKFTSGTNLTTAETGAMEYDGTNLYFTPTGTTRRTFAYVDQLGTATTIGAGAGTAGSPSMSFSGDTDTGLFSSAADTLGFSTGGTNRFNLSSAGFVSTTNGGGLVTSAAGNASAPTFSFAGDTDTGWFSPATNTLAASTGGTERVRIDSSGNVGIGTNNPFTTLQIDAPTADETLRSHRYVGSNSWPNVFRVRQARGTASAPAATQDGDGTGQLLFGGYDGTSFVDTAAVYSVTRGTVGAGSIPTDLLFSTGSSGGGVERMRITSTGNVGIGTTTPALPLEVSGTQNLRLTNPGTNQTALQFFRAGAAADQKIWEHINFSNGDFGIRAVNDAYSSATTALLITRGSGATVNASSFPNGNVGIGTTSPISPLSIFNATPVNGHIQLNAPSGQFKFTRFATAGSPRWDVGVNSVTESGSNAGSDFFFNRFDDSGSYLNTPLAISRSTGLVSVANNLSVTGNVGIGTTSPSAALTVTNDNTGLDGKDDVSVVTFGTTSPGFITTRSRGSAAAPAPIQNDDVIGTIFSFGHNGTSYVGAGGISLRAQNNWTSTASTNNSFLVFSTASAGTAAEKMRITDNGNVGIGTSSPNAPLEVSRDIGQTAVSIVTRSNSASDGGGVVVYRSRGTHGTPAQIQTGDRLGYYSFANAMTTNSWSAMESYATENHTSSAQGMDLQFRTVANGTVGGTTRLIITHNGNVGIGTTNPSAPIHVSTASTTGDIATFVSTGAGGAGCSIAWNGTSCSSDQRLKTNVTTADRSRLLQSLLRLDAVHFTWIHDSNHQKQTGFIAQQFESLFPEFVKTDSRGYKQVNYAHFVAVLTAAVQELTAQWRADSAEIRDDLQRKDAQIRALQRENEEVRRYLCKYDPTAPFCRRPATQLDLFSAD